MDGETFEDLPPALRRALDYPPLRRAWLRAEQLEQLARDNHRQWLTVWDDELRAGKVRREATDAHWQADEATRSAVFNLMMAGWKSEHVQSCITEMPSLDHKTWQGWETRRFALGDLYRLTEAIQHAQDAEFDALTALRQANRDEQEATRRTEAANAVYETSNAAAIAAAVELFYRLQKYGLWANEKPPLSQFRCKACSRRPVLATECDGYAVVLYRHQRGNLRWVARKEILAKCDCGAVWQIPPPAPTLLDRTA